MIVTSINLNKTKKTIYVGDTYKLKLKGTKNDTDISWKSSNDNIASVDDSGKVSANDKGKAVITATYREKEYKCTIKVKDFSQKLENDGCITIESYPAGADVYINGIRENVVAPCSLKLSPGEYQIELRIPGFVSQYKTVNLSSGKTEHFNAKLLPDIPDADIVLTVSVNGDPSTEENGDCYADTGKLSFREAVEIANSDPEHSYRIEFDDSVDYVTAGVRDNLDISASNLTINGDRDMDGTPDVIMKFEKDADNFRRFIHVCPAKDENNSLAVLRNFIICGVRFPKESSNLFQVTPEADYDYYIKYENIRVLNCNFDDYGLFAFGGACKEYGTGAKGYGKDGCTDYSDLYFCGNSLKDANVIFGYNGDCDYSIAENLFYCANTGDCISVITSDCNTWYIFGPENEKSGLENPETSDYNIVRNVTIRGNTISNIGVLCTDNGNSNNLLENVYIENNHILKNLDVNTVQLLDEQNQGRTLVSSGNILRNVICSYNTFEEDWSNSISVFYSDGGYDSKTKFIADNNQISDIYFKYNYFVGKHSEMNVIEPDAEVKYDESDLFICICFLYGRSVDFYSCKNNSITNIVYVENGKKK